MEPFEIRVDCYAGYRGEETPRRFRLRERTFQVEEVLDRWVDPDYRYFKLRADDDGVYILRHDFDSGRWEIRLFAVDTRQETRLSSP